MASHRQDDGDEALDALLRELARTPHPRAANAGSLTPGTMIGRFEVRREIGRGGFGVVVLARDRALGRHVALKVFPEAEDRADVFLEAEAVARLQHPNIVTLFDFGWHDGRPYLVFERLQGETLDARLARGPLDPREAIALALAVARGLVAAHEAGVCHHDLKPGNVFLTEAGDVKLLDFGIAALTGRRPGGGAPSDASPRPRAATPGFAAPERLRGEAGDARSDLFLVGLILCAALGLAPPLDGIEAQGAWSLVPPALVVLITALLRDDPGARPSSARALLDALTAIERDRGRPPAPVRAVRYAIARETSGGPAHLAYEVVGGGPVDLLVVPPFVSHLECWWDEPEGVRFVGGLAKVARVILFDKRGTGMSERIPGDAPPSLDACLGDMRAVLDAVGTRRPVLFGLSEGVQLAVAFAARHPESAHAMILYGGAAGAMRPEQARALGAKISEGWGTGVLAPTFAPSVAGDARLLGWLARIERLSATPAGAAGILARLTRTDVHESLAAVRAPTLVLHRTGDRVVPCGAGRFLARHIEGARFVEQPGDDHLPMFGDTQALLDEIARFLAATCAPLSPPTSVRG